MTASTMGVSTPASRAEGTGYYRYRGNQPHQEFPASAPLPQNVKATTAKEKRVAEYTRLRLDDVPKEEAAARIGVKASTASYYERDFQDQQRRVRRDG